MVDDVGYRYDELSATQQYVLSLHWSMSQLSLGSMEVSATNSSERMFSILMLLLGLLCSSAVGAFFASQLLEWSMSLSEHRKLMGTLRQYLRQMQVPAGMSLMVSQQIEKRKRDNRMLSEHDVPALTMLSTSVRSQLHCSICSRLVARHPVFRLWAAVDEQVMRHLCDEACSVESLQSGDDLFRTSESGDYAYFVIVGDLLYTQDPASSLVQSPHRDTHRSPQLAL